MGSKNNRSWTSFPPDFSIWLATEESFICIALTGNLLCWQIIPTAPTSAATPEAAGEKRHPSLQQLGWLPQIVLASAAPSAEVAPCGSLRDTLPCRPCCEGLAAQLSALRSNPAASSSCPTSEPQSPGVLSDLLTAPERRHTP